MSVIKNKPYMDQLNSAGYVSRQDEESVQKPPLVQKRLRPKPPVHFSFLLHRADDPSEPRANTLRKSSGRVQIYPGITKSSELTIPTLKPAQGICLLNTHSM